MYEYIIITNFYKRKGRSKIKLYISPYLIPPNIREGLRVQKLISILFRSCRSTLNERFRVKLQKKLKKASFDEFHLSTSFLKGATVVYPCLEKKKKCILEGVWNYLIKLQENTIITNYQLLRHQHTVMRILR